jgi:hypothetical protein
MRIMKNKTITALVFGMAFIAALSFVSADIIDPTYKYIHIENRIVNINEFPDYVFVVAGFESIGPQMCPMDVVDGGGVITSPFYKFCGVSLYAVKKSEFSEFNRTINDLADNLTLEGVKSDNNEDIQTALDNYKNYFREHSVKVADLSLLESAPITDTRTRIVNEITIDRNLLAYDVDVKTERSWLFYVYIIAPIVAIALIAWFLLRRKKQ